MIRSRLALKLSLLVLLCSALILGAVIFNTYISSRDLIVGQAEELSRSRGQAAAGRIAVVLKPVEQSVRNIALAMEGWNLTDERIAKLTRLVVRNNPDIFGMAIAFAPYGFSRDRLYFAPYSFRKDGGVQTKQLGGSWYHYFDMDWFRQPELRKNLVWTEPYFDRGGADTFMVTCSMPFYRLREGKRQFAGVVTADITLGWLQQLMSAIRPYTSGYAVLLSREGRFIYHPEEQLRCNATVFSLAETRDDPQLQRIGRAMIEGKTAFIKWRDRLSNQSSFLFYMPLPIGGWSLALVFPRDAVLQSVKVLTRNTLLIGGIGLVFFILAVILITRRVTRPIHDLSTAAMAIADGNLNEPLPPVRTRDEVGRLAESFQIMQQSLRQYIADLETTTRRQERMESELRIARDIQMGILPKTFPPFPEHTGFSIFAT
jgi:sigma-B regulation protein RsbU (phosphoserine phosphatase)